VDKRARYRAWHKAQGLCVDCPRPAEPGSPRCREHIDKTNAIKKADKARRAENGRCYACGRPLFDNAVTCFCSTNRREASWN
jgi:hypothetical protein